MISALLHDAPEDAGGEECLAEVRARFGDEVANVVAGCTDTYEDPKPPWRARKEAYLEHLAGAPPSVRLVSAADKLHNARSVLSDYRAVGEDLWGRFNGGREGTLWYYRAVADALAGGQRPCRRRAGPRGRGVGARRGRKRVGRTAALWGYRGRVLAGAVGAGGF